MIALAALLLVVLDGWALVRLLARADVGLGDVVVYLAFAGFLGMVVASRAAARVFGALRESTLTGAPVGPSVGHGLVTLGAAALLAWPGPATDAVALVLLIPWVGNAVARRLHARGRDWLVGRGVFVGTARPTGPATYRDAPEPPPDGRRRAARFDHPVA